MTIELFIGIIILAIFALGHLFTMIKIYDLEDKLDDVAKKLKRTEEVFAERIYHLQQRIEENSRERK